MSTPPEDRAWVIAAGVRLLVVGDVDKAAWERRLGGTEIRPSFVRAPEQLLDIVDAIRVDAVYVEAGVATLTAPVSAALKRSHPDLPVIGGAIESREGALRAIRSALLLSYGDEGGDGALPMVGTELIGDCLPMQRLRATIERSASSRATILVRGETGTGKELVARAIHRASPRASGPLVTIHCGALPEALMESELFGHEKGAFTGAIARKPGRVERAAGGTLFLDEIGEIPLTVQVKLLRLLQSREFVSVGGTETQTADVRFIAATHRDLESMIKAGTFREDLFYRLNVVTLWAPPLRARGEDIKRLATSMCARFAGENGRPGARLTAGALARLAALPWPGNVRQLQNFVERLVVLGIDDVIDEREVDRTLEELAPVEGGAARARSISSAGDDRPGPIPPLDDTMRRAERRAIARALAAASGQPQQGGRLLGISRASLYNKLGEHDLS